MNIDRCSFSLCKIIFSTTNYRIVQTNYRMYCTN